jgi:ABC-type transporter Mla subunit MlaD
MGTVLRPGLRSALLFVLAAGLAGCHGPGYRKSDVAAVNTQEAATDVQAEIRDLDLATSALSELVNQPAADAKPQFQRFSTALDQLSDSAKRAASSVERMGRKRTAYFEVWDKEIAAIKDEEVRRRSQSRREEVRQQFETVSRRSDETQKALQPGISYLSDIRKALSTDLTRNGLASMQPMVARANESAATARTSLTQLATDLDALSARTSSSRVLDAK